ncbi:hypothetical protein GCM10010412_048560 [Nonomuraea recticatena]|uniref:Pentapeptide repeat-containing protein n=1 Tax=Nonomuraea recticatena TaxID=46178 RepID=A0ABN3S786_9ACTN
MAWWLLTGLPVVANLPPITDPAVAASARNEILRTALAAGAGVGAAITLALAFRRQRHTEVVADAAKHDATERRVTELYTKAVEQLGHDKAAVRLGGLHALERLAQDTPVLRQTIVDVICAYLRMPFAPPREDSRGNRIRAVQRAARKDGQAPTAMGGDPHEERQVRLTAQRILAAHLRYELPPVRRWWQRPAATNLRFWPGVRLDLTGATLLDFDFRNCRVSDARFGQATFSGDAGFDHATFSGHAWFGGAAFSGHAWFGMRPSPATPGSAMRPSPAMPGSAMRPSPATPGSTTRPSPAMPGSALQPSPATSDSTMRTSPATAGFTMRPSPATAISALRRRWQAHGWMRCVRSLQPRRKAWRWIPRARPRTARHEGTDLPPSGCISSRASTMSSHSGGRVHGATTIRRKDVGISTRSGRTIVRGGFGSSGKGGGGG